MFIYYFYTFDIFQAILSKEIKKDKELNEKLLKKKKGFRRDKLEILRKKKSKLDYLLNPKKEKPKVDIQIEEEPMEIEFEVEHNQKSQKSAKKLISNSRLKSYGLIEKE